MNPCKHCIIASITCLSLVTSCTMSGAAQQDGHSYAPKISEGANTKLSERGEHIFRQLALERALSTNHESTILEIASEIIRLSPHDLPSISSSSLLHASIWLLSHEKISLGERLAEKSIILFPDDLPLSILLADIRLQQSRNGESLDIINRFIERNPGNAEALAEKGMINLRCGLERDALQAFDSIPEASRTPAIRFAFAQALNSVRKFMEAEEQLRLAVHEDPEYSEARQLLALTLEERGKKEEARSLYADLLKDTPKNVSARLFYLRSLLNDSDLDKASRVLADAPDPDRFIVSAIAMLIEEKKIDLAESFLEKLEQIDHLPPAISYYHAAFLVESGRNQQRALELLNKISPDSPSFEDALRLKIRIYNIQKDYDSLLNAVGILRDRHPEDVEPYLYTAEILCARQDYSKAEKILTSAAERHPSNSRIAFQAAYIMELKGSRSVAMSRMESVLKRFPDCVPALNYIGYNLADENRDLDRSLSLLTKAVKLDSESDFILDSMAWILYRLGRYEEAWKYINKALAAASKNGPVDPTILEHAGDIANAMKNGAEASSAWSKAFGLIDASADPNTANRLKKKMEGLHP